MLEAEFGVLVQLSFDLHEHPRDIFHHFVLLLKVCKQIFVAIFPPVAHDSIHFDLLMKLTGTPMSLKLTAPRRLAYIRLLLTRADKRS